MKKFVRITSTKFITVDPGILYIDMTNKNANIPDRLRVASTWVEFRTKIKAGTYWYPAMIKDWEAVKVLARDGVLTIGEEAETCDDAEAVAHLQKLENAMARNKATEAENKEIKKAQTKAKMEELRQQTLEDVDNG